MVSDTLKAVAGCYAAIRISMKAGLMQKPNVTTSEFACEYIACYATGVAAMWLLPISAPVGVAWAVRDAYVHRDTIIDAGHSVVGWCKDKVLNIRRSWKQRGALEIDHVVAVGEN